MATVACAFGMLSLLRVAHGQIAETECLPVSVRTASGTFTYKVWIEAGDVHCRIARAVVRDAALWPPGETTGGAGWRCSVGQASAISCARGQAVVRADGPFRETNPWVIAAARLRIPVLTPTATFGLSLRDVRVRACDDHHRWIEAKYAQADDAVLTIAEGKPYACGNLGVAPVLTSWKIRGRAAKLIEWCFPTGCARLWGDFALEWRERGTEIVLMTHGIRQRELLTIARSMAFVPT